MYTPSMWMQTLNFLRVCINIVWLQKRRLLFVFIFYKTNGLM